jgi:carbonic anhydrase/acetyltransferase-like protein (isoleucine patch superfamily)
MTREIRPFQSRGTGAIDRSRFAAIGSGGVFEPGVLVFHPESISLGSNISIGHQTILHGYLKNRFLVGSDTWIGPQCFLHSGGGLPIGDRVGIGSRAIGADRYFGDLSQWDLRMAQSDAC